MSLQHMKYLFITQLFPSGLTGTSVKTRNTIEYLLKQGHRVDVCCVHASSFRKNNFKHPKLNFYLVPSRERESNFIKIFFRITWLAVGLRPLNVKRVFDQRLAEVFNGLLKTNDYNQVFFDGYTTLQYLNKNQRSSVYIDDEDITDLLFKRLLESKQILVKLYYLFEWFKSSLYERWYLAKVDQIWAISQATAARLRQFSTGKTVVMPTVVPFKKNVFSSGAKDLVFTGTLNWPENKHGLRWFVSNCWSQIHKDDPSRKLLITGQLLDDDLSKFLSNYQSIDILGYVPDLMDVYQRSALAISPIFINSGIKVKVLTYLSYGLPVISTHESVLGLNHGHGVATASKKYFLKETLGLLNDRKKRAQISKQAEKYIKKHHSYKVLGAFISQHLN